MLSPLLLQLLLHLALHFRHNSHLVLLIKHMMDETQRMRMRMMRRRRRRMKFLVQ
jgi:hypothetical protein